MAEQAESTSLLTPSTAANAYAFFVVVLTPDEYEQFDEIEYRGRFSRTFARSAGTAGHGRWALIVRRQGQEREATHLGFARSTGVVSTFDSRVTVYPFVALPSPIKFAELSKAMAPIHYGALKRASDDRGGELTAKASASLRLALAPRLPDGTWTSLMPARSRTAEQLIETLHSQYDALATGFSLAGLGDVGVLRDRSYDAEHSVLETIRPSPTEPDLMARDLQHFSWSQSQAVTEHVQRFQQRGRILDVVNLNATPQEGATGVDLLYYNPTFSSFIGVQYKRVDVVGSTLSRVDDRLKSQIERMLKVEELAQSPKAPDEFRLGGSPMMFIKFARPVEVDVQVSGMAKGWYVPVSYADALVQAGKVAGAKGGATFTLDNLGRWLNNDGFTALAREGWIGSVGIDEDALRSYIDEALEESGP